MKKINVLMVGVDKTSSGGMISVARNYMSDKYYNSQVNLIYLGTATRKSKIRKIIFFILSLTKILWALSSQKIDIVHIHMAEKTSVSRKYIVMKMAKSFRCKVIVQLHAGPFMDWYHSLAIKKRRFVENTLELTDRLLVLGEYWVIPLEEIVQEDKLGVLYNGVSCPPVNIYSSESKDISFFGHLLPSKGINELLEAIENIQNELPPQTKVNLCGTSDEIDIEEYIKIHGLSDVLIYHGWVTGDKKKAILRGTALSVLPSFTEGLSMTVLESMAMGIPMITTNITTMPELLGGIIELIQPGDTDGLAKLILKLIKDDMARLEISEQEYQRVKDKFSVDKMISGALNEYKKLLY